MAEASNRDRPSTERRLLTCSATLLATIGVAGLGVALMRSLWPNWNLLPARRREFEFGDLEPGQFRQFEFENLPVVVWRRTPEMLAAIHEAAPQLADEGSRHSVQPVAAQNAWRSMNAEYLVVELLCTHLGCAVTAFDRQTTFAETYNKGEAGFVCPCHGARYDAAGRVFKNQPAPKNLVVPLHRYVGKTRVELLHPDDPDALSTQKN